MLFSEATGRKVVSTSDASTVGFVAAFIIDPSIGKVAGLSLSKTQVAGSTLPWADITAFGADAVTVAGDHLIVEPDEHLASLGAKQHAIGKKRVLDTAGHEIGTVSDVDFNPADGTIYSLLLDTQTIDGQRLLGVGSYAAVVHA